MAYEGHDWQNDEVITANLLNAMEDGIEKGNSDGITSVTVNTLDAGESATASVSGGVLTLGIPKGEKGDTGAAGAQGPAGPAGPTGPKGETGAAGAPGVAGPAGPAGPKGEKGDTGLQGSAGAPGAAGAAGPAGLGVKTITLTTDSTGKVVSGKWTDTTDGQHDIAVSAAEA